jgi:hypothetical protein
LLQAVPAIIQILFIFTVPESPRFLISKGRNEEAKAILVKHHANGDPNSSFVDLEYSEIQQAITQDAKYRAKGNWLDLVRSEPNRRRTLITFFSGLFIEISGNSLVSYYLHSVLVSIGIKSVVTQTTINGCLSIYNLVVAIIASLFVDRVGRRPLFLISTVTMLIAFVLWTAFAALYTEHKTNNWAVGVLVAIFLSNGAYSLGWTPLYSYPSELLPYEIRARGITFQTGVIHAFGFFGTFVNPIGLASIGWKYYIVYIVFTALEVSCSQLFMQEKRR